MSEYRIDSFRDDDLNEHPSPLRYLFESGARQRLVDLFLELGLQWDDDDPLTKTDIMDLTGMQRHSVIDHIPVLIEMGIVETNTEHRFERYEPAVERETFQILVHANDVLSDHHEVIGKGKQHRLSIGDPEEVASPWEEEVDVDIDEMGDADFERRTATLSLQDTSGDPRAIAEKLAVEWDTSVNVVTDRVVRTYLALIIDQYDLNLREEYDVVTLIPPENWAEQVESVDIVYSGEKQTLTTSVPPTVKDMINDIVSNDDIEATSVADFLRKSIFWISGE